MKNKRIRVLYTISNFNTSGSGKSVYDLVNGLDKTNFETEICCLKDTGDFYKKVQALGCKIHLFPFINSTKPRASFLSGVLKTRSFFKANDFDIIHSWHWGSDISEPLAAKLAGVPFVYTKKAMGWESRFWKWRSQLSSKVVAVNEDMMDAYFSNMLHKTVRFPLAIDTDKYQPTKPSESLKQQLGILPEDFVIITVANLVEVKGIETLLESVKQLNDSQIKVLIVGDDTNPYAVKLKSLYNANNFVQFLGKQLDVIPYLALADLFVIPTKDEGRREGIPNAPLEAMAMECIVLGSNISGIRDILKVFPDCMFQAEDVSGLAKKIKYWKDRSLDERLELGVEMRKRVVTEFSIKDFIKNHENLYLNLLN